MKYDYSFTEWILILLGGIALAGMFFIIPWGFAVLEVLMEVEPQQCFEYSSGRTPSQVRCP